MRENPMNQNSYCFCIEENIVSTIGCSSIWDKALYRFLLYVIRSFCLVDVSCQNTLMQTSPRHQMSDPHTRHRHHLDLAQPARLQI